MAVEKKEEVKGGVPKAENKGQALTARALKKKKGVATRRESQDKMRTDATHFNLDAQGRTAIKALQKYYNEQKSQSKSALFPEIDFSLHLMAVYKKAARVTPDKTSAYRKIELPFPLQSPATSTVCLIVRDLHMKDKEYNDPDVDKQAREWQEKLLIEQNITSAQITKILTRRQLEREYHTFADKRSLASAYDLFLVDNTVMKAVHDICGKEFHKAKKYPIAVKTNRPLAPQISKAFRITLMPVFKLKNRVSIKIGHLGQPLDELVKNMNECIVQLRQYCPGGTANIQSLYLQPTTSTPSLPIHASLESRNEIEMETPKEHKEKSAKDLASQNIVGELSTLPEGLNRVVVHPNGRVRVMKGGKDVLFPTIDDEHEERDDILPMKKTRLSAEAIAKRNAFHRASQRSIWKASKETKEKKIADKKPKAADDDAAKFAFRPMTKIRKSRNNKAKTAKGVAENGDGGEREKMTSGIDQRKRKSAKDVSAKDASAKGAPDRPARKVTADLPSALSQSKRKKRNAAESVA